MNIRAIARRSAGTGAAIAALLTIAPAANADVTPIYSTACSDPSLSQPFLAWGDNACYALVPGESPDRFDGSGWTLSGGANLQTTTLADGSTGQVLDLPSGSSAISPPVYINSSGRNARSMVRNVAGAEGVYFYISYPGLTTWKNTGQVHGKGTAWTLSDPINLQSSGLSAWQLAQFEFVAGGKTSNFQIYNFYFQGTTTDPSGDPRMKS